MSQNFDRDLCIFNQRPVTVIVACYPEKKTMEILKPGVFSTPKIKDTEVPGTKIVNAGNLVLTMLVY